MNGPKCTSDMHCVTDMHHMKALGAFGRVLRHGHGGRGRHYLCVVSSFLIHNLIQTILVLGLDAFLEISPFSLYLFILFTFSRGGS